MTDLGTYDENMIDKIKNLDVLLLEANHECTYAAGWKLSVSS